MTIYHSLGTWLTIILFYIAGKLIFDLRRPAMAAVRNRFSTFINLTCFGLFIGALGDVADGSYWGAAWGSDGLQHMRMWVETMRDWLFKHGIVFNIPFRQLADITSSHCHILALIKLSEELADDPRYRVISRRKYYQRIGTVAIAATIIVWYMNVLAASVPVPT